MSKFNLSKLVKSATATLSKHSPELLTSIGIAGMVTTAVMVGMATPKAIKLLEEEKARQNEELLSKEDTDDASECIPITKLKFQDTVKTTWKCYLPAVVTGVVSIGCLIGASSVSARRNAVLATAYSLSETAFSNYKAKVEETVGEKKEKAIRDEIAKEHIVRNPVKNNEVIVTQKGETLCYDLLSGRYFKSDIEKIRKAENELNRNLVNEMYISLNEFYYELGLKGTKLGDDLGWNIEDGLLDISFSSQLTDDGTPCLAMDYRVSPRYDYRCFE